MTTDRSANTPRVRRDRRQRLHHSRRRAVSGDARPRAARRRAGRRLSRRGGPLELRERDDLRADPARGGGVGARAAAKRAASASLILPRIAPLGAFEPTHDELGFAEPEEALSEIAPPAVGELTRRMTLARTDARLGRGAARRDPPRRGRRATRCSTKARRPLVADEPGAGVCARGRPRRADRRHDHRGRRPGAARRSSSPTPSIPIGASPSISSRSRSAPGRPGSTSTASSIAPARRPRSSSDEIARAAQGASRGPTIIAGSTGTNRATARLIAAIARAPQRRGRAARSRPRPRRARLGARSAPATTRRGRRRRPSAGGVRAGCSASIGVARDEVKTLGAPADALRARAHSSARRCGPPTPPTFWRERRKDEARRAERPAIADGLAGVAMIVADNETEEALALAVAMREALETPGKTAALITPDAALARRVAAELARWGVEVENSAGPHARRTRGRRVRAAGARRRRWISPRRGRRADRPSAGSARAARTTISQRAARALELGVLARRRCRPRASTTSRRADGDARAARGGSSRPSRAASARRRPISRAAEALLRDSEAASAPLRALGRGAARPISSPPIAPRSTLSRAAKKISPGKERGARRRGARANSSTNGRAAAERGFAAHAFRLRRAVRRARSPANARRSERDAPSATANPRPARSAPAQLRSRARRRARRNDLAAGGRDRRVPQSSDARRARPFRARAAHRPDRARLRRRARRAPGDRQPREKARGRADRRLAVSPAHGRRRRRGGDARSRERAARNISGSRARSIDPKQYRPTKRPEPRPPRALRPDQLSVTRIETLRRDPYAIFAESILRLEPLAPIGVATRPARDRRRLARGAASVLRKRSPSGRLPADAARAASRHRARALRADARRPGVPRLALAAHRRRAATSSWASTPSGGPAPSASSSSKAARLEIPLADGSIFTLTARADRIEALRSGGAALIDYKTGAPPGNERGQGRLRAATDARSGDARARRLRRQIGAVETGDGALFQARRRRWRRYRANCKFKDATFAEVVERHFAGLKVAARAVRDRGDALSLAALSRNSPARGRLRPPRAGQGMVGDRRRLATTAETSLERARAKRRRFRCRCASRSNAPRIPASRPGCPPTRVPARPMCWCSACCACCSTARRPRGFSASPSPRRRPRTCRRASSRRWRSGRALDDDELARAIVETGAPAPDAAGARLRASAVRAHHRDAGRPEDPDDPRLLRASAASLSVRGQCRGGVSRRSRSARRRCSWTRRARALSPLRRCSPERDEAIARIARVAGAEGFDDLIEETLGRRERNRGARRRRGLWRGAAAQARARRRARPPRRSSAK